MIPTTVVVNECLKSFFFLAKAVRHCTYSSVGQVIMGRRFRYTVYTVVAYGT